MAIPQVKFSVIASGINEAKNALSSVQDHASRTAMNIRHIHENNALKIKEIEERKAAAIKQINNKTTLDAQQKADKIKSIEERISNQIISIKNRESLKVKQIQEKALTNSESSYKSYADKISGILSSVGANSAASSTSKLGSIIDTISGAKSGSSGSGGFGGIAGGIAVAGAAVAVSAAAIVVKSSLDMVADGLKYAAGQFASALLTIGGARNISESLVENAESQRAARGALSSIPLKSQKGLDLKQVDSFVTSLSEDPQLGGMRKADIYKGIEAYLQKNPDLNTLIKNKDKFALALTMSSREGISNETTLGNIGTIQQTRGVDFDKAVDIYNRYAAKGQATQYNVKDLSEAAIWTIAGKTADKNADDTVTDLLAVDRAAGFSASESATGQSAVIAGLEHMRQKGGSIKGIEFDKKTGRLKDYSEAMKILATTSPKDLPKEVLARKEALDEITRQQQGRNINFNDSLETRRQKYDESLQEGKISTEDLDNYNLQLKNGVLAQDELKASFNKLSNSIGGEFGPLLDKAVPSVKNFIDALVERLPNISNTLEEFGTVFKSLVPVFTSFATLGIRITGIMAATMSDYYQTKYDIKGGEENKQNAIKFTNLANVLARSENDVEAISSNFMNKEKEKEDREESRIQVENILKEYENNKNSGTKASEELVTALSETLKKLESSKNEADRAAAKELAKEVGRLQYEGFKEAAEGSPPELPNDRGSSPNRK